MDRGICISWYDLPDRNREEYLGWLHERYLPAVLNRPGIRWAAHYATEKRAVPDRLGHTDDDSVPKGNDYILLIGADTAHAFSKPRPDEASEDAAPADKKMLALRVRERMSIMAEEARAEGPAASAHTDPGLARCVQVGSFNPGPTPADGDDLLTWYARWRLPCMAKLPGLVRVRKLVGVTGWSRHGVLYEFESLEARDKYFPAHEKPYPEVAAWSDKVVRRLMHAPGSPHVAQRLWPK
ncbi:MAG TPA: hypothetical protein VM164_02825 [Burkholderiales bacterium]|nr:hypothetical protein [Burkholderiales bacterium]